MKRILAFALVAVSGMAAAQDSSWIAKTRNRDGGQIVITSVQGNCPQGQLAIYTVGSGGSRMQWGCVVTFTDNHIMGRWSDGNAFAYDYAGWILNDAFKPRGGTF